MNARKRELRPVLCVRDVLRFSPWQRGTEKEELDVSLG